MEAPAATAPTSTAATSCTAPLAPPAVTPARTKKLHEALYFPGGQPRYDWVPASNPWDPYSISDNVKDTARGILMHKVRSRGINAQPSAKEWELMNLLGDPKEQGPNNPFMRG